MLLDESLFAEAVDVTKDQFLRDLAEENYEDGTAFNREDFEEFKSICSECGYEVSEDDFDDYFDYFDEIRAEKDGREDDLSRLDYLRRKEKVAPLDKGERYEITELESRLEEAYSTDIDLDNYVVSIENDNSDYLCIDFSAIDLKRSEFNKLVSKDVSFDEKIKLIDYLSAKSRSLLRVPSDEWLDIDSIGKRSLKKLLDACIEFLKNNESNIYIQEDTAINEDLNDEMIDQIKDKDANYEADKETTREVRKELAKQGIATNEEGEPLNESIENNLEAKIRKAIREFFSSFDDEDYKTEIEDYLAVEIVPENGKTKVEVRAELGYRTMDKLADALNPIVQAIDKDAYFDHEDSGIINAYIFKPLKEDVGTMRDDFDSCSPEFRYQLLDRMRADCDYYLKAGNRQAKHLWAKDEQEQIDIMKALWNSFSIDKKPSWLTMDQINDYADKMLNVRYMDSKEETIEEDVKLFNQSASGNEMIFDVKDDGTVYVYDGDVQTMTFKVDNVESFIKQLQDANFKIKDQIEESLEEATNEPNNGIVAVVNSLIIDEWDAIQGYNDAIVAAEAEGLSDIASVLHDILDEENLHVGQLQRCMEILNPSADKINAGEAEARDQLDKDEDPEEGMHY